MRYSRRISNYSKIIILSYPTYMMSMIDLVVIGVERPKIDNGYSFNKDFIESIRINPGRVLYIIVH